MNEEKRAVFRFLVYVFEFAVVLLPLFQFIAFRRGGNQVKPVVLSAPLYLTYVVLESQQLERSLLFEIEDHDVVLVFAAAFLEKCKFL